MQAEFNNVLSILLGIVCGLLCFFTADYLQKLAIRRRKGTPITWSTELGEVIDEKKTTCQIAYILIDMLLMVCAFVFIHTIINIVYVALVLIVLTAISIADNKFRIIPNTFSFILLVLKLISFFIPLFYGTRPAFLANFLDSFGGFIIGLVFIGVFPCIIKGSIGGGDIKLAMAVGFLLGCEKTLYAIALSGVFCIPFVFFVSGNTLIQCLRNMIPLGPPLCAATITILIVSFSPLWIYIPSL